MKIREFHFREIYHRFVRINDITVMSGWKDIKFPPEADSIIMYCYIDEECGTTFAYMCPYNNKTNEFLRRNLTGTHIILRYETVKEFDADILKEIGIYKGDEFIQELLDIIDEGYDNQMLAVIRDFSDIDDLRCEGYPYDIKVQLIKYGLQKEIVWVRWNYVKQGICYGILTNEPTQDFGIHFLDKIKIEITRIENEVIAYCNCNKIENDNKK